ncbi:hypothetical protein AVEN_263419-1 [Araneus ventricosus]|uniref:Pre-C2HC domain-containing protein n=1 Tax=Araneus ventricosus TaxID=182803 RepID=A0A4Y2QKQ3_ARAVE|nr:hypothetical protein AVEN_263419-1 [Araneus ventricosus]
MKRSNPPITDDDPSTKKQRPAEQGPCHDESNSQNESVKKSTLAEIPTSQMDCLVDSHVSNDKNFPAVMMIKSNSFEAHLQLINEKFGELRIKKAGKFIKLFTDNDDMHRQLISFLTANNIGYLTPKARQMKVLIMGLPCDMKTQQIKEALIEKDLDVEKIVQLTDYSTKKSLPLFKAVLRNSDRNKKIFNLAHLLNLNVSVEKTGRGKLRRHTIKCGDEHTYEKSSQKPEADVPKSVNCGETGQLASCGGRKKSRQVSKTGTTDANLAQAKKTYNHKNKQKQLPRMNSNMDASEPTTDLQDIIYIMQEFRKLFGKFNDAKTFAQQLRNAKNSVEKFELFSAVFLD